MSGVVPLGINELQHLVTVRPPEFGRIRSQQQFDEPQRPASGSAHNVLGTSGSRDFDRA